MSPFFGRISKIGWYTHPWQRTTLLSDKAVQPLTAKVYVFSDSVLCLGRMHAHPESVDAWKKKIEWFTDTPQYRELDRIDGEKCNSSGKFSQDSQHHRFSLRFRKRCTKYNVNLNSSQVESYSCLCKVTHGHWSFIGPGSEKKRYGSNTYKPNGEWDGVAEHMLLNFSESGHPVFRGTSALERGTLRSKRGEKLSTHFCGDPDTAELIFRTIFPSFCSVFTGQ